MILIKKVYKTGCNPCEHVSKVLEDLQKEGVIEVENLNLEANTFGERKKAKSLLGQFGTIMVPLLHFSSTEHPLKETEIEEVLYKEQVDKLEDFEDLIIDRIHRLKNKIDKYERK